MIVHVPPGSILLVVGMGLVPYLFVGGVCISLEKLPRRGTLGIVDVLPDGPVLDVLVCHFTLFTKELGAHDKVCQTSEACTISLNTYLNSSTTTSTQPGIDTSLTCSSSPFVYSSSHLSCSVIQPTVQALFPGDTTLTITRTLNSSLTPGGVQALTSAGLVGGDAIAYAQLWLDGIEQFYCRASECVQTVSGGSGNGSTWECGVLDCTCRPGAAFCGGGNVGLGTKL
jgi:hypothetical protein